MRTAYRYTRIIGRLGGGNEQGELLQDVGEWTDLPEGRVQWQPIANVQVP